MASTVLITGASAGIGRAIAARFAQPGYNVVLAARHPEPLFQTAAALESNGCSVLAVPTDVRDIEQVKTLVDKAMRQYGQVDVLVNNAGIYISGPAHQFSLDDWHQVIDTNLWGYIHTIHTVLPHFVERGAGTIVNIGSIGGRVPLPYLTPYTTAKFAITGLTQALRAELAHKGIQVCGVYPSIIKSSFLDRAIFRGNSEDDVQARRQQVEQMLELPVVESPEDVAKAVWNAVQHGQEDVVVGSAKLSLGGYRLLPGGLRWAMQKIFQHQD